ADAKAALEVFENFNTVLDVFDLEPAEEEVPAGIMALAEKRQEARQNKDFAAADALRDELKEQGWFIEDNPGGWRVKRL
ncbi:MAG: hypothetical protein JXR78_08895, partial [Victivallales bacterium]|nr:hypothetical protein [Victivallales bacterium]